MKYILVVLKLQNVVIEWIASLLLTQEVLGSSSRTILIEVFHCTPQALLVNVGIVPQIRPQLFPSTSFSINYSLIILSFDAL
jgi:hypothetical protein